MIKSDFQRGLNSMRHRGPDSTGEFISREKEGTIYLGMNRLAITGIATGGQPLHSRCKSVILTFNGEIYNYQEIWQSIGLDYEPRSDGDAIIELYLKSGLDGFKRLRGMFAISLYDLRLGKIFLLRDWFGEKPLYLYKNHPQLLWSSNIQGIVMNVQSGLDYSNDMIADYFRFTYVPSNETVYKNIFSLDPGSCYTYDLNGNLLETRPLKQELLRDEAPDLLKLLPYKIKNGLIGETGVGVLLSGGIDSGIIALYGKRFLKRTPLHSFTIASGDQQYDESDDAKEMASFLNIKHTVIDLHKEFNADKFFEIVKRFEQPYADSSFIASWTAFDYIRRNYPEIKVVLTGDGGDEIWGGYNKHKIFKIPKILNNVIKTFASFIFKSQALKALILKFSKLSFYKLLKAFTWRSRYMGILSLGFDRFSMSSLFEGYQDKFIVEPENLEEAMVLDHSFSLLNDLNVKTDQASMFNSLEARSPLLDIDLYRANKAKFHSKKEVALSLLNYFPADYLYKKKRGFSFNLSSFLLKDFRAYTNLYLEVDKLKNIPGIDANVARKIVDRFYKGEWLLSFEVYSLLIASIWFCSRE